MLLSCSCHALATRWPRFGHALATPRPCSSCSGHALANSCRTAATTTAATAAATHYYNTHQLLRNWK
eukprot:9167034-Lingulodinium_polyedra.AAC.1